MVAFRVCSAHRPPSWHSTFSVTSCAQGTDLRFYHSHSAATKRPAQAHSWTTRLAACCSCDRLRPSISIPVCICNAQRHSAGRRSRDLRNSGPPALPRSAQRRRAGPAAQQQVPPRGRARPALLPQTSAGAGTSAAQPVECAWAVHTTRDLSGARLPVAVAATTTGNTPWIVSIARECSSIASPW